MATEQKIIVAHVRNFGKMAHFANKNQSITKRPFEKDIHKNV